MRGKPKLQEVGGDPVFRVGDLINGEMGVAAVPEDHDGICLSRIKGIAGGVHASGVTAGGHDCEAWFRGVTHGTLPTG
jgi:hypothetical protein